MDNPIVSVIIPTFNRSSLVCETVKSVLAQSFSAFEIHIILDGCTDNTESELEKLKDPRIAITKLKHFGRPAPGRNVGLRLAKGEYVGFCDDDDLWHPKKLEMQIEKLNRFPKAGMCHTGVVYFNDDREWAGGFAPGSSFRDLIRRNFVVNSSVLFRRSIIDIVGFLDEDPDLRAVEDWEYWIRVVNRMPILFVDEPLVRYRVHGSGISSNRIDMHNRRIALLRSVRKKLDLGIGLVDLIILECIVKRQLLRIKAASKKFNTTSAESN